MTNPFEFAGKLFRYSRGEAKEDERNEVEEMLEQEEELHRLAGELKDKENVRRELQLIVSVDTDRALRRLLQPRRRMLWRYAAGGAAVMALLLGQVLFMRQESPVARVPQMVQLPDIKVPMLITTGKENTVVAFKTLDIKDTDKTYIVGEEKNTIQAYAADSVVCRRVVIPAGYTYKVQLADGSQAVLNAGSELRFPDRFCDSTREVELKGEAYFEVVKSVRPFVVKAGQTRLTVYGTRFNLFYSERLALTEAVLAEGSIGIAVEGKETRIVPNQRLRYTPAQPGFSVDNVEVADYMAWMGESFKYKQAELDRIVFDISRWYGVKIELAPELKKETFSLEFDKSSTIDWVVRALELMINKPVKLEGAVYYIE